MQRGTLSQPANARQRLEDIYAGGFAYSKQLRAHTSCINATCWSHGTDVKWLATAGDDRRILLWDMHDEDPTRPAVEIPGATGNIFDVAFSAHNTHVMCGGVDETVRRFDMSQPDDIRVFNSQNGTIRQISNHPTHDELFLSASEDGTVVLYDARTHGGRADAVSANAEFSGVQYHPMMHDVFITSDVRGRVFLHDTRMAFADGDAKNGIVRQYVTTLSRRCDPHIANPEASSIAFDSTGERFAVVFLNSYPTIYATADEQPVAICTGTNDVAGEPVPSGVPTYANCCTIKHGTFGGPGDAYYATGSDDFRGYAWKIPNTDELLAARSEVGLGVWVGDTDELAVGFTTSMTAPRVLPQLLNTPAFRLTGHDTLVNSVRFHPHAPLAVSAGVESFARLHSPFAVAGFTRTSTAVRALPEEPTPLETAFLRALRMGWTDGDEFLSGDAAAIACFDHVVREESGNEEYMFTARAWGEERPTDLDY